MMGKGEHVWNQQMAEYLVELVKAKRADIECAGNQVAQKNRRQTAWKFIATSINAAKLGKEVDADKCQKKWQNLRSEAKKTVASLKK